MFRWFATVTVAAAAVALAAGCTTNIERVDSAAPPAAETTVTAPSPANPAPSGPAAPAPAAANSAGRAYEADLRKIAQLEAAYQKNPGDASAKARLVAAKYDYAARLMEDPNVPPMQKYRPALKAFREVLALDPNHKEAAQRKAVIEDIYRSMGRPVPS